MLVDGDGYIFQSKFFQNKESGGAEAAQQLLSDVKSYVKANPSKDISTDFEVMVNVYANKKGLAKTLTEAGYLSGEAELESFFRQFNQSQPLFHFIDCGYGKESADAKLRGESPICEMHWPGHSRALNLKRAPRARRSASCHSDLPWHPSIRRSYAKRDTDTYRFFAYNCHCRYILLACCHDNGYVAELKKYAHDPVVSPKTCLVQASQPAHGFQTLSLPVAGLESVFEPKPVMPKQTNGAERSSYANVISPVKEAAMPIPIRAPQRPKTVSSSSSSVTQADGPTPGDPRGIPVNRSGQRVDRPMRQPTTLEQERFEARISYKKLCNEHLLRNACKQYYCKYDHDPLDAEMEHTLRYKARGIACVNGMACRQGDCYYGHHCPWPDCWNKQCAFLKRGLHNVTDLTVAKFVPAES